MGKTNRKSNEQNNCRPNPRHKTLTPPLIKKPSLTKLAEQCSVDEILERYRIVLSRQQRLSDGMIEVPLANGETALFTVDQMMQVLSLRLMQNIRAMPPMPPAAAPDETKAVTPALPNKASVSTTEPNLTNLTGQIQGMRI